MTLLSDLNAGTLNIYSYIVHIVQIWGINITLSLRNDLNASTLNIGSYI